MQGSSPTTGVQWSILAARPELRRPENTALLAEAASISTPLTRRLGLVYIFLLEMALPSGEGDEPRICHVRGGSMMKPTHLRLVKNVNGRAGPRAPRSGGRSPSVSSAPNERSLGQSRLVNVRRVLTVRPTDVGDIAMVYCKDVTYRDPVLSLHGVEQVVSFLDHLLRQSLDHELVIIDEVHGADAYSATWVMTGAFLGFPYEAPGMSLFRFRPGQDRICYQRNYYSEGDLWANVPSQRATVAAFRRFFAETVVAPPALPDAVAPRAPGHWVHEGFYRSAKVGGAD